MVDGSSQPALFGFPVHLTDAMPAEAASAVACLFGNWPGCVAFGSVRDGLNVQLSSRGSSDLSLTRFGRGRGHTGVAASLFCLGTPTAI